MKQVKHHLYHTLMNRDESSVIFLMGSTSNPLAQMIQLVLILLHLPFRQLRIHTRQMTTEMALSLLILQQSITARLL